jgi:hypothetical protein
MKKMYLFLIALLLTQLSFGQLTGTKTIPGDYPTITAAIAALNASGVGTGGVTFNVAAGYTETLIARLDLTATGTSSNPIIFQKSGSGADPLITAYAGSNLVTSSTPDGMWSLTGSDYVTIDGIDLQEAVSNNTPTFDMEYGYGLFKTSGTDGANHNTIKNCTIALNRDNNMAPVTGPFFQGSVGIVIMDCSPTTATANMTVLLVSGASSNNKFYNNTIKDVNCCIAMSGFPAPSPDTLSDVNNDIGGSSSATGNTLINFGGGAAAANPCAAIYIKDQWNFNISYNTVNNNNGSGINHPTTNRGIWANASSIGASATINNNTVTINCAGTTTANYNIDVEMSTTGSSSGNTISINNNNILNSNFATATTGAFYGIYLSAAGTTVNITGNSITGLSYPGTGTSAIAGLIYNNSTGTGTLNVTNNSLSNPTFSSTATVYGIYNYYATTIYNLTGNQLLNFTRSGASGTLYGIYISATNTGNFSNNILDGFNWTLATSTGITYGIVDFNSVANVTYSNNIFRNFSTPTTGALYGIKEAGNATGVKKMTNNQIYNFTTSTGGAGGFSFYGLWLSSAGSTDTISGNSVYNINSTGTIGGTSGSFYCLYISPATTNYCYKNSIYNISSTSTTPAIYGIYTGGGTTNHIFNNFISDLRAPNANTTNAVNGIYVASGTTENIYYNTIFLNATSTGTNFGTSGIYAQTGYTVDMRNNIIVNTSIANGTGYTVAYRRSSTTLTSYAATSNNNDFYAGTPSSTDLIYFDGTNKSLTLAAYTPLVYPRDVASVTENPPFVNVATTPYNLHIQTTIPTQCESGGTIVFSPISIVDDVDSQSRYPNPGYPNNVASPALAPDIGADEFAGLLLDLTPPGVIFTPFLNTSSTIARTLTTSITDVSGVPISGIGLPRLYWKINSGSWQTAIGSYVSGSTYTFTFGAGVNLGDIIYYYIVAQDAVSSTPNVGATPSAGASGLTFNPPAAATPPTTPYSYTIIGGLCGTYNVGVGQTYTTITAAMADLGIKEVTCPVTFVLTDATYSASETFPITVNPIQGASAVNTITIKPAPGVTPVITGSSTTGIFRLSGANYFIIDGSNSGGTDKSLTWENTNTSTNAYTLGIFNTGTVPASNDVIKNCLVRASSQILNSTYAIYLNASAGGGYNNIVINNNTIYSARYGMQFEGVSGAPATNGQITNNIFGSTVDAQAIQYIGLYLGYADNTLIQGNEIMGASLGNSNINVVQAGLYLSTGCTNTKIRQNKIHDWYYNGTGGNGATGIYFKTGDASTPTEISNNLIYNIKSDGYGANINMYNLYGILIYSGGNVKIYYNSINLTGNVTSSIYANWSGCICIFSASCSLIDIRDNILKNSLQPVSGSPASKTFAIMNAGTAAMFSSINNNDYFVNGIGPNIGCFSSNLYSTLASWQVATTQDANSLNIDPQFVSSTDLHTVVPALNNAGIAIPGIITDYVGVTRGNPPDIGAYEFSLSPVVTTNAATAITATTATLNGTVNALNESVVTSFNYGLTAAYGSTIAATPTPVSGLVSTNISTGLTGLLPATTYHFRARGVANSTAYLGLDTTFTTLPSPTITGPMSVCLNSTGNIYTTEAGYSNYVWSVSAGGTITAGGGTGNNTVTVTWNTAGVQTVSVNYNNSVGFPAPSSTIYNVTVNSLPVPSITGPASVCIASTGNVYTTQAGMTNYQWSVSAGGTITSGSGTGNSTVTVTWNTAGAQTVSVNYTNSNNCTAASPTSYPITVNALPTPTITGTTTVCAGTTGNVYTTQAGMTNYQWSVSAGGTITAGGGTGNNTITVTWNNIGTQTVSVNYSDANGCTAISPTVYFVTVNTTMVPFITGPDPVCVNSTGNVYATQTGMTNYLWSVSAGGTITAGGGTGNNSITVTWNTAGAQSVTVDFTNAYGCTVSNPTSYPVTVNSLPTPTITGTTTVCAGTTGNVYTTQAGMTNYIWMVSAGGTITGGGGIANNTVTVTWNTAGVRTVSVNYTNANGCTAVTPFVINVTVNALPVPSLTGPTPICGTTTGNIYTTDAGMTNYIWTVSAGGTITAGGTTASNTVTVTWSTSGVQTVSVNYTNANGCTAASPTVFNVTVNALPTPTVTGPTAVCVSTAGNVYITQVGMTNYVWSVSAGGTVTSGGSSTSNTVTVTWNMAGAQFVEINYSNANGCTAPVATTLNVTVSPRPVPTITGPNPVCVGTTGNAYSTQTGMSGYTWVISTGGTITSGTGTNTITVTWNTVGSQTVSVNYNNVNGCPALTPTVFNVTVNALPIPAITGPASICVGTTGNVYTTQPGMTNYIWSVSASGSITAGGGTGDNFVTVTWNTAGAQTVRVNYTNSNGCTASSPTVYNVTVNSGTNPTITGSTNLCVNSGYYTYTTEAGMTAYNWAISSGGVINYGGGTNVITVTWMNTGAQWVSVNYINPSGCTTPNPTQLNITVNPIPGPAGSITGTSAVCGGANGVAYSVAPITGATAYVWALPAGATIASGANTNAITVNFAGNASSGVIIVNGNNTCGDGAASPPFAVTVTPLPDPAGTITGQASVCQGTTGVVYTVPPITGATAYVWTVPTGFITTGGSNSNSITVTISNSAVSGNITVYGSNSCGSGTVSPNFAVTINVIPATPVVTNVGDTLHSSAPTGNQWYFAGTLIPGAIGQTYITTQNGLYWSIVTLNGCSSAESNHLQIYTTGIDPHSSASINIYPVPNDGRFNVSITTVTEQSFSISVYNSLGVKIYEETKVDVNGSLQKIIDLKPVPNGVYSVVFESSLNQMVKKIVVNK